MEIVKKDEIHIRRFIVILFITGLLLGGIFLMKRMIEPENDWVTAAPAEVGLDPERIENLITEMHEGAFGQIDGLVIIKDGKLIVDEYGGKYNVQKLHTLQSVTKSIAGLLIGIAIDQGKIKSVDEKVLGYFKGVRVENIDARKKAITIRDLLTMRGGFDWDEFASGDLIVKLNRNLNWVKTAINVPMRYPPGEMFLYNSGGVIILDHILKKATGMYADQYAEEYLFKPLNIKRYFWGKQYCFFGTAHTGGGLFLTPQDLAKIGQMVLNKGEWRGKRVVSEKWLNESFTSNFDMHFWNERTGYGYLWALYPNSLNSYDKYNIYACCGHGGQRMFVVPEYNMVVVITASEFANSYKEVTGTFQILYGYAIRAAKKKME